MLKLLELRDFALIGRLELELAPGLNAFTGETGAGKSILVDALLQLAGNRADTGLIRSGAAGALIQGEFDDAGQAVTLTRKLQQAGRSTARIDGEQVTLSELTRRAGPLIAIHGQHASLELADRSAHLHLLDRLLPPEGHARLADHAVIYADWRAASQRLKELEAALQERARRLDTINFQLDEIRRAALKPGEEEELRSGLAELRHADTVASGSGQAVDLLSEADSSVIAQLAAASRALDTAARYSSTLEPLAAELKQSLTAVQATAAEIEAFVADFEADPRRLERAEARLAQLEGLQRKYGQDAAEILTYAAGLEVEQGKLEGLDTDMADLEAELQVLEARLDESAAALSGLRKAAAVKLESGLLGYLRQLGMDAARFETEFKEAAAHGRTGRDQVRFLFSANPGEPVAPLTEVASGGELSRLLLGLNLVAGADQPVLVFDEVDAGTGGKAAIAIGTLLRELAAERQVLVVTHLPQVAAFAHVQFQVSKRESEGRTLSAVRRLDREERIAELARMLSGSTTEASLRAAEELLAAAARGGHESDIQPTV